MRLADINGPKGGKDKSCLIQVYFEQMQPLLIESLNNTAYQAVNSATERMRRLITSRLGKLRKIERIAVHYHLDESETVDENGRRDRSFRENIFV